MKGFIIGLQSFLVFLGTVSVAFAEEVKKEGAGGGYDAVAILWYALIALVLVWGIYDSFFRPVE